MQLNDQLNDIVFRYATLFEVSTKEAGGFIESFVGVIERKYPDAEIILLEKEEENVIFVLKNEIKVKFSPPEIIPIVILPAGYSANKVIYNFQLCTHLGSNRDLITEENIALLRRLKCKNKTPEEITELYNSIADAFKIPMSEREKLWSLVGGILPIINRIKQIEKQRIKVGIKVVLEGDKRDFREVYGITQKFCLKLRGISEGVDPLKVKVL